MPLASRQPATRVFRESDKNPSDAAIRVAVVRLDGGPVFHRRRAARQGARPFNLSRLATLREEIR